MFKKYFVNYVYELNGMFPSKFSITCIIIIILLLKNYIKN